MPNAWPCSKPCRTDIEFARIAVGRRHWRAHAAVRAVPPAALGIVRRYSSRDGESDQHHGDAPTRGSPALALRSPASLKSMLPTIAWQDHTIVMVDQRKLSGQEVYVHCKTPQAVAKAITTMIIRGAPAIGVAAAMGIAMGMRQSKATGTCQFTVEFNQLCELMAATRPTAVSLFIDRMKRVFGEGLRSAGRSADGLKAILEREANAIHDEDVASCKAMGRHGAGSCPKAPGSDALQCRRLGDGRLRLGGGRHPRRRAKGAKSPPVSRTRPGPFCRGPG